MKDQVTKVRLGINETVWTLIEEVARVAMTTPKAVLHAHFLEVLEALTKGNSTAKLSAPWLRAWENVENRVADDRLLSDSTAIDLSVLHTSRTTNSGFEGVYAHSNPARGFIAQGRDAATKKPGKHLGLFPTAAQAAWARYQHYKQNGMPYGKLEEEMEKVRNDLNFRQSMVSERWVRPNAIWRLALKGVILPDLPDSERKWETTNPGGEQDYWDE